MRESRDVVGSVKVFENTPNLQEVLLKRCNVDGSLGVFARCPELVYVGLSFTGVVRKTNIRQGWVWSWVRGLHVNVTLHAHNPLRAAALTCFQVSRTRRSRGSTLPRVTTLRAIVKRCKRRSDRA